MCSYAYMATIDLVYFVDHMESFEKANESLGNLAALQVLQTKCKLCD